MKRPAFFLDRDGVIIEEVGYLSDTRQMKLLPGAAGAIREMNRAGVPVLVITNQAGVARGYFTEDRVIELHRHLDRLLASYDAHIDRYYYCPHHPQATVEAYRLDCACRKPKPGMLYRAASEFGLSLADSVMVGDKMCDVLAGLHAGCKPLLVLSGYGVETAAHLEQESDLKSVNVAADLCAAVKFFFDQRTKAS